MSQLEELDRGTAVPDCPYVGLRDYTEEYADFFFGRDAERKRIIGNLGASRLTLLYAESGVGKSSLLRAGVVPRLREHAARGRGATSARYVPVVFSSWGGDPTESLIDAIADAIDPFVSAPAELPRGTLAEAVAAAAAATDATMLVILDQFEELFLYSREGDDDRFAEELARCINRSDLRANFLIAIREDAYASVGDLLKGRVANVYANYLHLDYLDREAATEAIVKPIERFNELRPGEPEVSIEAALVDAALDQVRRGQVETGESEAVAAGRADRGDAMTIETTYLQLVMKRLWDEEAVLGSSVLRLETLERLGGAQTIIGTHLDQAMAELPDEQRDAAAAVFRFLVTSTGTKIALTVEDLVDLSGLPERTVGPMLRRLAAADRHILRPVVLRDSPERASYEIFHDALARPILDWRTRYARQKLDVEVAAQLEAERTQRERAQEEAHDAAAREQRERRLKRLAVVGLVVAVVALLAVGLGALYALSLKRTADRDTARADSVGASRHVTELYGSPTFGPDAAALAGMEATRLSGSFAARAVTLGALQSNVAMPAIGSGHTRAANAVAFLSNSVVASGSSDGTIRVWDGHARSLTDPLTTGSIAIVSDLAVDVHDGRRVLLAARGNGTVDLWDVTRPRRPVLRNSFRVGDDSPLNAVAVSPDGSEVVVGGDDQKVSFWSVSDPSDPKALGSVGVPFSVQDLAFTADGTQLAVAGADGVAVLTGPDFAHAALGWLETDRAAHTLAFAPDGSLAYSFDVPTQPGIGLRSSTGATRVLPTTAGVYSLAFTRDSKVLVSGGIDADVTTWDVASGREYGPPRMEDGQRAVRAVSVSPDARTIAAVGDADSLKLWPLEVKGSLATTLGSLAESDVSPDGAWVQPDLRDLAVGPDGQVAAAADSGGAVIWRSDADADGALPSPIVTIPPKADSWTTAVAYHGDVLAVASGDSVTTWRTGSKCRDWPHSACQLSTSTTIPSGVTDISFGRKGNWLATGDYSGHVTLWKIANGKIGRKITTWTADPRQVNTVAVSPTGDLVATADDDGSIEVRDVRDPRSPRRLERVRKAHDGQWIAALAFSPDGKTLASGGGDQQTVLWSVDLHARRPLRRLSGSLPIQTNTILALAFSPDGSVLAAGDGDGAVCLYDVQTRGAIGSGSCLIEHYSGDNLSAIWAIQFTPDGAGLLSAGLGNPVVRWDSVLWSAGDDEETLDRVGAAVCRFAGRNLTVDEWQQAFADTQLAGDRHQTCPAYPLP